MDNTSVIQPNHTVSFCALVRTYVCSFVVFMEVPVLGCYTDVHLLSMLDDLAHICYNTTLPTQHLRFVQCKMSNEMSCYPAQNRSAPVRLHVEFLASSSAKLKCLDVPNNVKGDIRTPLQHIVQAMHATCPEINVTQSKRH